MTHIDERSDDEYNYRDKEDFKDHNVEDAEYPES